VDGLAGVVALSLVAALVHQLARRTGRSEVTRSLADNLLAVVLVASASCLAALVRLPDGGQPAAVALAAAATCLLLARAGDRAAPRPVLVLGGTRSWPGLLLGLAAATGVAAAVASGTDAVPVAQGAILGLNIAATAAIADLAVDLGAAGLTSAARQARQVSALPPVAALLPYAVLAPVALITGRLVLG